jgi:hypothetical protein
MMDLYFVVRLLLRLRIFVLFLHIIAIRLCILAACCAIICFIVLFVLAFSSTSFVTTVPMLSTILDIFVIIVFAESSGVIERYKQ